MLSALRNKWDSLSQRGKIAVGAIVLFVIFILPAMLLFYRQSVYSAKITLTFAPKSADAKIGDMRASFGDNDVKPGTYKVEISKKGFATYTQTVTAEAGKTLLVEAALVSNDPSTADWYQTHTDDYTIAQGIGDRRADREYTYMTNTFPIAKDLPIVGVGSTYRVDYGISPTDSTKYAVLISYDTEADKQDALTAIRTKGYTLSDYEVVYSQNSPIVLDGISVTGMSAFSKRGLSAETVNTIQEALVASLRTIEGQTVTRMATSGTVTHLMSDDNLTDTYGTTLSLNGSYTRSLQVVVHEGRMTITVSNADGSGSSVIYTGASS